MRRLRQAGRQEPSAADGAVKGGARGRALTAANGREGRAPPHLRAGGGRGRGGGTHLRARAPPLAGRPGGVRAGAGPGGARGAGAA